MLPPSCEYKSPFRRPPEPVKKHAPVEQTVPLAVSPVPAIKVLRVGSVGSRERLAIESDACLSVSGVQVVPPFVVFQIPPAGVPTNKVFASSGSATTGPTAPATFPFGGASRALDRAGGPKTGSRALRHKILVDLELRSCGRWQRESCCDDDPTQR